MVAPDDVTFGYLEGRAHAPKAALWDQALQTWQDLATDEGAVFEIELGRACIAEVLRDVDVGAFLEPRANDEIGVEYEVFLGR